MRASVVRLAILMAVVSSACSDAPEQPQQQCVPGKSEACVGEGGCAGGQVCNQSGSAFGPCVCAPGFVGGGDGGSDGGLPDAGDTKCDPTAAQGQQGCGAGTKCTWVVVADTPEQLGEIRCVPDGTAAVGAACTQGVVGATTGFDDCVGGAICVGGTCKDICSFTVAGDCGQDAQCTRYSGLFANGGDDPVAGACTPSCNPVTQSFSDGGTCGANQGCYLLSSSTSTIAVCAGAGTIEHNQPITGTAFANSCVPGAAPRRRDFLSNDVECGALCAPANVTSTTNVQFEAGVPPYDCQTRTASSSTPAAPPSDTTAGESCRYYWAREPLDTLTPYSNTVGWCFKHAAFMYDSNGDATPDAPFPRCTSLTTGDVVPPISNPPSSDAEYFWCVESQAGQGIVATTRPPRVPLRLDRLSGWR